MFVTTTVLLTIYVLLYMYVRRVETGVRLSPKRTPLWKESRTLEAHPQLVLNDIFYVHVPKCGSSFATVLVQYACPTFPKHRTVPEPTLLKFPNGQRMNYTKLCGGRFKRFSSGHDPLPANLEHEFSQSIDVVTFLRSPDERIISGFLHNFHDCDMSSVAGNYSWFHPKKTNYATLFSEEHREDLARLYQFYWGCVKGCATSMMLGQKCGFHSGDRSPSPYEIETAMKRVEQFAFVGLNDKWEESMRLWQCMFGGEYSQSIMENNRPSAHSNLKPVLRNLTRALNLRDEADDILYLYAESQFAHREEKYCGGLDNHN
jgi:hypothetical protein